MSKNKRAKRFQLKPFGQNW